MLNALLSRWTRPRASSLSILGRSTTNYPPARNSISSATGGDSLWQSLLRLIPGEPDPWGGKPTRRPPSADHLAAARDDFLTHLKGLQGESIVELQRSIRRSRSLRDLWHLRTWLYTEIARAHSQHEAEQCLALLNTYFASSAARRH